MKKKNEVLARVMVLACVMMLACDGWRHGSHGLSARRKGRSQAGPKGRQLEVGPRRGPRLLVTLYCFLFLIPGYILYVVVHCFFANKFNCDTYNIHSFVY